MPFEVHTIAERDEEPACYTCGEPQEIGDRCLVVDTATVDGYEIQVGVCSEACAAAVGIYTMSAEEREFMRAAYHRAMSEAYGPV